MKKGIKSKRGMTASFLIGMMITLVAFVLISGVLMRFMSEADDLAAENLCYDSIALRAMTAVQLNTAGLSLEGKLVPPLCQTIDKKVSGGKEEVMKEVADSMARCWWMFGAGEYEAILDNGGISSIAVFDMEDDENECFNCYTLLMDEKDFDGEEYILSSELQEFMENNTYSRTNMTYIDYIQSYGGPGRFMITTPVILPNEGYTVSMIPKMKDSDANFWKGVGEVVVGGVIVLGVVAGVVCVVFTVGACGVAGGAVFGASVAASTAAVGAVGVSTSLAVGTVAGYMAYDGYNEYTAAMVKQEARDVSSVMLSYQATGEELCSTGDLAGN